MARKPRIRNYGRAFLRLSFVKTVLFSVWSIAYVVCVFLRSRAFNNAQTSMLASGYQTYTVQVTSPFFTVLKIGAFLLPVLLAVWTAVLYRNDRKHNIHPDKLFTLIAFGADILAAFICMLDVTLIHMVF